MTDELQPAELAAIREATWAYVAYLDEGDEARFEEKMSEIGAWWRKTATDEPAARLVEAWSEIMEDEGTMTLNGTEQLSWLSHLVFRFPPDEWKEEAITEAVFAAHRVGLSEGRAAAQKRKRRFRLR
jgi:hypothetical protein